MIQIRVCTEADASLIADLSRQTFYETFASANTAEDMEKFMTEQFTHEALVKEVGTEGNIFFLASEAETPVGYARMREGSSPPDLKNKKAIEIARIYAVAASVGKGVGKALMQKCIEAALEKGAEIMWLGVWEKNQRAIDFYIKWGFEKFTTHVFMLGNDSQTDWLMKKNLKTMHTRIAGN